MSKQEWKTYKLGELANLVNGFAFKGSDFIADGVPVIKIKNVKPTGISLHELSYVSREIADKVPKYRIQQGDILISMSGNRMDGSPETWVGKVALFKEEGEYLLNQRVGILRVKSSEVDKTFLSILLSSFDYQLHFITAANSSGGQANISPSIIADTEVGLPTLVEQKRIASIISSLDDKIELNRQMNATLEAIAQVLFKEWFIDFNFPGASGEIVESELGMIPVGWKVGSLLDIGKLIGGGTPKTSVDEYWNGDISWISAKDVSGNNHSFITKTEKTITEAGLNNSSAKLLPKLATVITARGTVGNYCILSRPMTISQSNYALKPQNGYGDYFLYMAVQSSVVAMQRMSYGTIFDTITTETLQKL